MPVRIKPKVKLSVEQWRKLLGRILEKQEAQHYTPEILGNVADDILKYEPPVTKEIGRLYEAIPGEIGAIHGKPLTLPFEEARRLYEGNPARFLPEARTGPPVDYLRSVPPGDPDEFMLGLAYERLKFKPVQTPQERARLSLGRDIMQEEQIDEALASSGLSPEDFRPGVDLKTALAERGVELEKPNPTEQLSTWISQAEQIWKLIGGARSLAGKHWEKLRTSAPGQVRHVYKTGKDWFIASYTKFMKSPGTFKSKHPREYNVLTSILEEISK